MFCYINPKLGAKIAHLMDLLYLHLNLIYSHLYTTEEGLLSLALTMCFLKNLLTANVSEKSSLLYKQLGFDTILCTSFEGFTLNLQCKYKYGPAPEKSCACTIVDFILLCQGVGWKSILCCSWVHLLTDIVGHTKILLFTHIWCNYFL